MNAIPPTATKPPLSLPTVLLGLALLLSGCGAGHAAAGPTPHALYTPLPPEELRLIPCLERFDDEPGACRLARGPAPAGGQNPG